MTATRSTMRFAFLLAGCFMLAGFLLVIHSGEMEPPGPPGPTMKPLDEIEARRAIHADMLPLRIEEPGGSWYLAHSINTTGGGIEITVDDVTIDLNGFLLEGGTGHGIYTSQGAGYITVRNGTVRGWAGSGIYSDAGVAVIEDVVASHNGAAGISVGHGSRVSGCSAGNNNGVGIYVDSSSLVENCFVGNNISDGIATNERCRVINSIASINGGNGIYASTGSMVSGCVADYNDLNGIRTDNHSYVHDNICRNNSEFSPEDKAGIFVLGSYNRIDNNHVEDNAYGVRVDGAYNTIIRNSAIFNTLENYKLVTPNDVGPIGNFATATSPWANHCVGACP